MRRDHSASAAQAVGAKTRNESSALIPKIDSPAKFRFLNNPFLGERHPAVDLSDVLRKVTDTSSPGFENLFSTPRDGFSLSSPHAGCSLASHP
jgi:hypothetical protein